MAEVRSLRFSWHQHGPLFLIPLGILLAVLAFFLLSQEDESSWQPVEDETYEYHEAD